MKAASGVARVRFDTQKTIEVTNAQDQQVARDLDNGFITIQGSAQPPVIATPAQVTNVGCFGASTGAINITVSGGVELHLQMELSECGYTRFDQYPGRKLYCNGDGCREHPHRYPIVYRDTARHSGSGGQRDAYSGRLFRTKQRKPGGSSPGRNRHAELCLVRRASRRGQPNGRCRRDLYRHRDGRQQL